MDVARVLLAVVAMLATLLSDAFVGGATPGRTAIPATALSDGPDGASDATFLFVAANLADDPDGEDDPPLVRRAGAEDVGSGAHARRGPAADLAARKPPPPTATGPPLA